MSNDNHKLYPCQDCGSKPFLETGEFNSINNPVKPFIEQIPKITNRTEKQEAAR